MTAEGLVVVDGDNTITLLDPSPVLRADIAWHGHTLIVSRSPFNAWDGHEMRIEPGWTSTVACDPTGASPFARAIDRRIEVGPLVPRAGAPLESDPPIRRLAPLRVRFEGPPGVRDLAMTEDRIVALYTDHRVRSWCPRTGLLLGSVDAPTEVPGAQVSIAADGRRFVQPGPDGLRVRDVASGEDLWRVEPGDARFSLTSMAEDRVLVRSQEGCVTVYDRATPLRTRVFDGPEPVTAALSTDGRMLAFAHDDRTEVLDLATGHGEPLDDRDDRQDVHALVFSPNARRLAVVETCGHVQDWELDAPRGAQTLRLFTDFPQVAVADDGRIVGGSPHDPHLWMFDPVRRKSRALAGHLGGIGTVALSERWIASGGDDGAILVRRPDGRLVATFQLLADGWVTFTPRGAWVGEHAERWMDGPANRRSIARALR